MNLREMFPDAEVTELTELQHAETGEGPWKIYVFGRDGMHSGGKWFRAGKPKYPDEEITYEAAKQRADKALAAKGECRICDGGDNLVYHSVGGHVIYGAYFWQKSEAQ